MNAKKFIPLLNVPKQVNILFGAEANRIELTVKLKNYSGLIVRLMRIPNK